jgi:WD40 repeat protein
VKQDFVHCPITALAFYTIWDDQYILAGEDAWLKVYDARESFLLGQLRVFAEQSIHGFSVSDDGSLLVWGAQSVSVIPRRSVEALIHGRQEGVASPVETKAVDWIYDGCLSPFDEGRGVLITAHNEVVPFRVDGGTLVFGGLISPSRPILYSAAVEWTESDCVLVAAGTVFGEIVVWKCHLTDDGDDRAEVMFVFTGHEGSIFGVAISPVMNVGSVEKRRFLASCSDDRTVRIWDITEQPRTTATVSEPKRISDEARETGFGDNGNSETVAVANQAESSRRCLAVGMGHASRIWHVKFEAAPDGVAQIYSFGEDTTVQGWQLREGDNREGWHLDKLEATGCHNGKHIWSAAVASSGHGKSLIATGGADGKVTLLGAQKTAEDMGAGYNSTIESRLLPSMPFSGRAESPSSPRLKNEGFLRYAFLSEGSLLISTTSGRVLLASLKEGLPSVEVDMSEETREDLKLYNVAKTIAPGTALLGSGSGRVYIFRQTGNEHPQTCELEELARLPGKITDILPFPESEDSAEGPLKVLVTVLGSPEATIFTLNTQQSPITFSTQPVPLHKGFITTSVALCNDLLILGSRKGIVTAYKDTEAGYTQQTHRLDCKTKGGDAVTSITILPPLPGAAPRYFLTTCRDGKIRIYEVADNGTTLELRHETTPPLGPMLEGARFFQPSVWDDPELIIYGFRSTNFVVWNETRQVQLASVACGGAHRTFDYFTSPTNASMLRLVYTKASAMSIYSQNQTSLNVTKPGGHGREIRSVASQGGYIATGAEDTCIRIWERPNSDERIGNMRCLAVLQKHTAGIQALKWFGSEYLLSSAGGEEFFIWRVTRLESAYKGLAVVFEAKYPDRTKDGDLRITDFDITEGGGRGMVVTLVFSNSTLKTYRYASQRGFELICQGRYTGACLTQVRHLRIAGRLAVLTASTDGFLAVWKQEREERDYGLVLTSRVHQSSIKSLDISSTWTTWQVMTGGDDNGLGILSLEWDYYGDSFAVTSKCRVRDAHAAAITGVGIVQEDDDYIYLATVSNDQRLKIWRVENLDDEDDEDEGVRVALVDNQYSALADPGGLDMIAPGKLMVAGVGMEIWSLLSS